MELCYYFLIEKKFVKIMLQHFFGIIHKSEFSVTLFTRVYVRLHQLSNPNLRPSFIFLCWVAHKNKASRPNLIKLDRCNNWQHMKG